MILDKLGTLAFFLLIDPICFPFPPPFLLFNFSVSSFQNYVLSVHYVSVTLQNTMY